ncbi:SDR family oxidoreductase [Sphingomonas swuensis]|uniref:SDR family oxidoreductase n=1 Tax=Sphingomonas swuensis TaxID=977800 RepID=A0ABP7SGW7_9SPHN
MNSVVIGASGGIGLALADRLEQRGETVHRLSRRQGALDLTDEATIAAAAASLEGRTIDRLVVATGLLHDEDLQPERSLRQLDPARLLRSFAVNAVGPALVLKHFAPLLRRDGPSRTALLSARVGSIADNRLGGWYGYRASKAALNQLVRSTAIEIARTRPEAVVVALHPGTVDTGMSRPFQANVPDGQLLSPGGSAERLLAVLDALTPQDSGGFFDWRGEPIPF